MPPNAPKAAPDCVGCVPAAPRENEAACQASLDLLGILDTPPEPVFDRITALAARLLRAPHAYLTFVDRERQWIKSCHGGETGETSRDVSFCAHALLEARPFVVRDARADARFADNPLVVGPPYIRLYAGAPIRDAAGFPYGTLCVVDRAARDLYPDDLANLVSLAEIAGDAITSRYPQRVGAEPIRLAA